MVKRENLKSFFRAQVMFDIFNAVPDFRSWATFLSAKDNLLLFYIFVRVVYSCLASFLTKESCITPSDSKCFPTGEATNGLLTWRHFRQILMRRRGFMCLHWITLLDLFTFMFSQINFHLPSSKETTFLGTLKDRHTDFQPWADRMNIYHQCHYGSCPHPWQRR